MFETRNWHTTSPLMHLCIAGRCIDSFTSWGAEGNAKRGSSATQALPFQELLAAGRDTTKTMVWLYSSTLENPNSAGKILTGHGLGMCGSASHASAALEQLNRSCESLFFFCASLTCWSEVHCMDLICHWGQQEDLESPQVARLSSKELGQGAQVLRILTLQVMKPMKPNATWKRWNNIHFVESVECFLFVTICFFLIRTSFD